MIEFIYRSFLKMDSASKGLFASIRQVIEVRETPALANDVRVESWPSDIPRILIIDCQDSRCDFVPVGTIVVDTELNDDTKSKLYTLIQSIVDDNVVYDPFTLSSSEFEHIISGGVYHFPPDREDIQFRTYFSNSKPFRISEL